MQPRERSILLAIVVVFTALALLSAATRAPWCDEAYFAEPAYQILKIGRMATLVNPPSPIDDPRTFGTDRFIFWTLPLDIVLQAGWYKIFGFGMIRMRVLSLLWGLVAIGAWWTILKKMGADPRLRLAAIALVALDYTFIRAGSEGRMDMMSAALGSLGIAVFLTWERRRYTRAVFLGAFCCAASALTHPIGGMLSAAGLGVTILWYSRGRFRWWHPGVAAVPYLFFFGAWGIYIAQAPDLFQRQLLSISGGRLGAWRAPLTAIWQEFAQRWAGPFGLTGGFGLRQIRALVFLAYAAGLAWALVRFRSLARDGFGLLPAVSVLDLALLCFGDSTKSAAYLVHVLPWLGVCLAILLTRYWRSGGAIAFTAVLAVQMFGTLYTVSRLQYQREYLPAVEAVKQRGGRVTGDAELGFALGFQPGLVDDRRLGFYSGTEPALFAIDNSYQASYESYRATHPEIYAYVESKIARSRLVFQNSLYRIYRDPAGR